MPRARDQARTNKCDQLNENGGQAARCMVQLFADLSCGVEGLLAAGLAIAAIGDDGADMTAREQGLCEERIVPAVGAIIKSQAFGIVPRDR